MGPDPPDIWDQAVLDLLLYRGPRTLINGIRTLGLFHSHEGTYAWYLSSVTSSPKTFWSRCRSIDTQMYPCIRIHIVYDVHVHVYICIWIACMQLANWNTCKYWNSGSGYPSADRSGRRIGIDDDALPFPIFGHHVGSFFCGDLHCAIHVV